MKVKQKTARDHLRRLQSHFHQKGVKKREAHKVNRKTFKTNNWRMVNKPDYYTEVMAKLS